MSTNTPGSNEIAESGELYAAQNNLPAHIPKSYTPNDSGRAEHFVDKHLESIRYVPAWNCWLIWEEHHWRKDDCGEIKRLAVKHSSDLVKCATLIADHSLRNAALKDAIYSGDEKRINQMLAIAKCDPRIVVRHNQLDADPDLLAVQNGVIDLRTGVFRAGRREDFITKRAGVQYVHGATCPQWQQYLNVVLAENEELISYLQRYVGYTLTGHVKEQCFAFLYGSGKNGKSVFTELLLKLLGEYGQKASASLLVASHNGREPTHEIARLQGARLVVGSETEEGARLAESRVKDLTGGDTLTGRFLYAEAFDFRVCLKLWMFGNHKPEIRGTDDGIWRRVRLIPFTVQIPEASRDPDLSSKLAAELPGILNWALHGVLLWKNGGLGAPSVVTNAGAEYRNEEDTLGDFIREETEAVPGARTSLSEMFLAYKAWAELNGMRFPLHKRLLNKRLSERGFVQGRANREKFWEGVSLKSENHQQGSSDQSDED
jgi:putative DNA primase/helicase